METTHEESSGNVFADLGLPNSEQELVKAKLTVQIYQILRDRKITQIEAARLLGTTQAQVSALMRCRPVSVSVGKLMEFLTTLGQDVEADREAGRAPRGRAHVCHRAAELIAALRSWLRPVAGDNQGGCVLPHPGMFPWRVTTARGARDARLADGYHVLGSQIGMWHSRPSGFGASQTSAPARTPANATGGSRVI